MIDFNRILLNSYIKNKINNSKIQNINLRNDSFDRLFESSMESLFNVNANCKCNRNLKSLEILTNITGFMNKNRINDIKEYNYNNTIETKNNLNKDLYNNKLNTKTDMLNAINLLKEQVGKPYVWGGDGPNSFDCSGLVRYIYKNALGKDLPRVSYEQSKVGQPVNKSDLQVGDLVFFDTMDKGRVSHVGIYIGNNEFIHAANPKKGVIKSELSGYYDKKYMGARRP